MSPNNHYPHNLWTHLYPNNSTLLIHQTMLVTSLGTIITFLLQVASNNNYLLIQLILTHLRCPIHQCKVKVCIIHHQICQLDPKIHLKVCLQHTDNLSIQPLINLLWEILVFHLPLWTLTAMARSVLVLNSLYLNSNPLVNLCIEKEVSKWMT